nr:hypothetical protein Iba_chr06dCG7010 [Ipomoea batatas]
MLQRPRRLELIVDAAHGPVKNDVVGALFRGGNDAEEGYEQSNRAAEGLGIEERRQLHSTWRSQNESKNATQSLMSGYSPGGTHSSTRSPYASSALWGLPASSLTFGTCCSILPKLSHLFEQKVFCELVEDGFGLRSGHNIIPQLL